MTIPVSTQWTLDAVGPTGRVVVESVYMVACHKTGSKGSGWLHTSGHVVTNEHVVRGCGPSDIWLVSTQGARHAVKQVDVDAGHDLALLSPASALVGGLEIDQATDLEVGMALHAWGFPLGYNGPAPLLSVGYLAGFIEHPSASGLNKHLVVNGAFNPGNSGGPVFAAGANKVRAVVVSKHAPISQFHESAIEALAHNESGIVFEGTDGAGKPIHFVESQVVADLLKYFRGLTQVMIGEAISAETLGVFLRKNGISG